MEGLVARLSAYDPVILSNFNPVNSQKYEERGWHTLFSQKMLSHEAGLLKPGSAINVRTLEAIGSPRECVFIDDQPVNLPHAAALGMKVIHYQSNFQLEEELRRLSVE